MKSIKLGKYQHFKGNIYQVIAVAYDSETLAEMVVYQGLYKSEQLGDKPFFVRPLKMFLEEMFVDGKKVPRFKYIGV